MRTQGSQIGGLKPTKQEEVYFKFS